MAAARCRRECALEARSSVGRTLSTLQVLVISGVEEGALRQQPGAWESTRLKLARAWA